MSCISVVLCAPCFWKKSWVQVTLLRVLITQICADQVRDLSIIFPNSVDSAFLSFLGDSGCLDENFLTDFVISTCFNISNCVRLLLGRHEEIFIHSRLRINNRPQSTDTTKVQVLLNQWVLLGPFRGIWVRGYFEVQKWLKVSYITQSLFQHGSWKLACSTAHISAD